MEQALSGITLPEGFTIDQEISGTDGSNPDCFDVCTTAYFTAENLSDTKTTREVTDEVASSLATQGWKSSNASFKSTYGLAQIFHKGDIALTVEIHSPVTSDPQRVQIDYTAKAN
jgi:hypothetical protein